MLGQPAIESLNLIKRVSSIETVPRQVEKDFPHLFTGLGKIQQPYTIQLQEDAKPYALSTPRRIPIPLMGAVKERMVKAGIISQITEPTEWCTGMVVVRKKNNKIHIC